MAKAVIRLDVPDWQIGSDVTVYFKDTMVKRGVCEAEQQWTPLDTAPETVRACRQKEGQQ